MLLKAEEGTQLFTQGLRTEILVVGMTLLNSFWSPQHILDVFNCSSTVLSAGTSQAIPDVALGSLDWCGCVCSHL